jgi:hypothetical protein
VDLILYIFCNGFGESPKNTVLREYFLGIRQLNRPGLLEVVPP